MNTGPQQFLDFMLERAKEESLETVRTKLMESFEAQRHAPITRAEFEALKSEMLHLMKPEKVEEVTNAMNHFGNQIK